MLEKILVFIIGSCVGSFLNVCIYRIPKNISIIKPFSFCPKCNVPINWFDNIPIISYLLLRGRCRSCKKNISFRYILVELITACIFLFLYTKFYISNEFLKFTFLFSLLIVVSFIDIDYHAVPVSLCLIGIAVGFLFSLIHSFDYLKSGSFDLHIWPIWKSVEGLIVGFGFTYLFKFFGDAALNVYLTLRKKDSIEGEKESLGLGDVDFMGLIGVFLGSRLVVTTFFIAPFVAVVYSVFAILFKKSHLIPYLPYLSLAAFISFLWGTNILAFFGFL